MTKLIVYLFLAALFFWLVYAACEAEEVIRWGDLVEAVIQVESGGDSDAHNNYTDATGLMQITPICLREFNRDKYTNIRIVDMFIPELNKVVGIWYLKKLHRYYRCRTIPKVLAAYNFGIGNVRSGKAYPRGTRNYIKKVMALYEKGEK